MKGFSLKGLTPKEVASEIASSALSSNLVKNITPTTDELNKTIANNVKLSSSLHNQNIRSNLATMFQGLNVPEEEAVKMAKNINVKNYNETLNSLGDNISQYTDKPVEKILERAKNITEEEISKSIDPDIISKKDKILKYPIAYYSNPDTKIKHTRFAATAGAYAGLAIGGRYLSGGTLTTDSYGRKDIAGIPFI